jgi:hypothetical protein
MKPFKQPFAEVAMTVNWYSDTSGTSQPSPALVTFVGEQAIRVAVIDSFMTNVNPKEGVRHKDDPQLAKINQDNDSGCWDHTGFTKRLMKAFPELYPTPEPPTPAAPSARTPERAAA